jgi:hypothetical protein
MRFKKLRVAVALATIIFVLLAGSIIALGLLSNAQSVSQTGTLVNENKRILPGDQNLAHANNTNATNTSQNTVSNPVDTSGNTAQNAQDTPTPVQTPVVIHMVKRTRAS